MPQVPVNRIHWNSPRAFAADVLRAFEGLGLARHSALLLTAHAALSSGWGGMKGGAGLANYMMTGIKATDLEHQDWIELHGSEWHAQSHHYVGAMMKWRAFGSVDEAAGAMLGILQRPRYVKSYALLLKGDPNYFAQVGRDGWYTAPPAEVAADMRARLKLIRGWLPAQA